MCEGSTGEQPSSFPQVPGLMLALQHFGGGVLHLLFLTTVSGESPGTANTILVCIAMKNVEANKET